MARSERAQWARLDLDGTALLADLAAGSSLARVIEFQGSRLQCFGAPVPISRPLVVGDFSGRVERGASCNCSVVTLTPHANGTHTEGVGHLTVEPLDVHRLIPQRLLLAALLSVQPERAAVSRESSSPAPKPDDLLVTRAALERAWIAPPAERLIARALIVRTLPNLAEKFSGEAAPAAPFLTREAALWLVERGIEHLVIDVPSVDRGEDGGELTAHRILFGLPVGSKALSEAQRREATITELAYVADSIADGWYFLSLQSPAMAGDAVPTRPVLYPLRTA